MHWTLALIAYLVLWAMAGGLWRRGSLALAGAWAIGQAYWAITGNSIPIGLYWPLDLVVIAAFLHWRTSKLDWLIIALFPLEWAIYFAETGAGQWWALWALTCIQLALAGPWPWVQRAAETYTHGPRMRGAIQ
jgi:hypothetical protein